MPRTAASFLKESLIIEEFVSSGTRPWARRYTFLSCTGSLTAVSLLNVIFDDGLELVGYVLTLESHGTFTVNIHRSGGEFAGTRQANTDISMPALSRPVHHATHDRDTHGFHARVESPPFRHLGAQVGLNAVGQLLEECAAGTTASRTGYHQGRE